MKSGALTTAFVCFGALIVFITGTAVVGPFWTAAALGAFFFVTHLFSHPRALITLILFYVSFANVPRGYMTTKPFTLVFILCFAAITFFLMFENVLKRGAAKYNPEEKTIRKIAVYILLLTALSIAFHNLTRPVIWLRFAYMYMLQVPLLVYCLRHVRTGDFRKLFKYLTFLFIVQLVMNGAWLLHINPLPNVREVAQDFAYGTLKSCRFVALFSISMFSVYLFLFDTPHSRRWMWWSATLALLACIQFYLTYTNHMFMTAAILFLVIGVPLMRTMRKKMLWVTLSLMIGLILIGYFSSIIFTNKVSSSEFEELFSNKTLTQRYDLLREGPKGESYKVTFTELHGHNPINWALGVGPGMYMSKPAFLYATPLAWEYMGNYYLSLENERYVSTGGITVVPMFGMGVLYGELGILGSIAYLGLYLYPVFRIGRQAMRGEYTDHLQSAMARAFVLFVILFLIENFAFDWLDDEFCQVLFAVWAAAVWKPDQQKSQNARDEKMAIGTITTQSLEVPSTITHRVGHH